MWYVWLNHIVCFDSFQFTRSISSSCCPNDIFRLCDCCVNSYNQIWNTSSLSNHSQNAPNDFVCISARQVHAYKKTGTKWNANVTQQLVLGRELFVCMYMSGPAVVGYGVKPTVCAVCKHSPPPFIPKLLLIGNG